MMMMRASGLKAWISAAACVEKRYQTEASPARRSPLRAREFRQVRLQVAAIKLWAKAQVRAEGVHLFLGHVDVGMRGQVMVHRRRAAFGRADDEDIGLLSANGLHL